MNLPDSEMPSTQRVMTPLLCLVIAHPQRHNPKAWTHYGCKITIIFADMQIYLHKKATYVQKHKWQGEFEEFMRILFIHSLPDIFVSHPPMVVANDTY